MRVGILGSGDVAKTLAGGFLEHGHDVTVGSRTPAKLAEWAAGHPAVATGTFADAHLVRAFNSVGNACMVNPQFKGGTPTMFICGNSEAARAIEPLCMLWCIPGFLRNDRVHAFKLLA